MDESWGTRLGPLPPPGWPPVGEGVSGSVELGLREREDSDCDRLARELLISPRLTDFSMPYAFFVSRGLSAPPSPQAPPSGRRFPPLGVGEEAWSCSREAGLMGWLRELLEEETFWWSLAWDREREESESERFRSLRERGGVSGKRRAREGALLKGYSN